MELWIQLLGTVELSADGRTAELGSTKERLVLASLAWSAGRAVSDDRLVDRLWGEGELPQDPRKDLQVYASRIRSRMKELGIADAHEWLVRKNGNYIFRVDPEAVDVKRYLGLLDRARGLVEAGSTAEGLSLFDTATSLWTGDPLSGLAGAWPEEIRKEVGEHRLAAVLLRTRTALRQRRYAEAVTALRPMVEQPPENEELTCQYALALHGAGRTEEASHLLQRTTKRLHAVAGRSPGAELRRVHEGILNGTPAGLLLNFPVSERSSPRAPGPDNLPPDALWTGREEEVLRLTSAHAHSGGPSGVATITGMPGSGKTALAVHVAHLLRESFPEGRLFVDLRGNSSERAPMTPVESLTELLHLLGVGPAVLPTELEALVALWRTTVQDRRFVAVLDDAAGTEQLRPLLPGSSSPALVLITSRCRLTGLSGVRALALDELSEDDAVALLTKFLGDRVPERREAVELARTCGRLPLALDIAANRLLARPSWTPSDLLRLLHRSDSRLPELHDAERELSTVFAVSYRSLTATQQLAFRRLALHPGSEFDDEAAAALTGLSIRATERVLEELLTSHLLTEPSPHRYRFHDLLREYARALGAEKDEENSAALHRLVVHYTAHADAADRRSFPHRARFTAEKSAPPTAEGACEDWLRLERPNLSAVLEHLWNTDQHHEFAVLTHTLADSLHSSEDLIWAGATLSRAVSHWRRTGDDALRAFALLDLAAFENETSHYEEAANAAREALRLARQHPQTTRGVEVEALHQLSITFWHTAEYQSAAENQQAVLRVRMREDDPLQQARSLNMLGMLSLALGRPGEARTYFLAALARFRGVHDNRGEFAALNNLSEVERKSGNFAQAEEHYREAMERPAAVQNPGKSAVLKTNLGNLCLESGRLEEADELYRAALPVLRRVGDRRTEIIAQLGIGRSLLLTDRPQEAVDHFEAVRALAHRLHVRNEEAEALHRLGTAESAAGLGARARSHLEEARDLAFEIGSSTQVAEIEADMARVADSLGSSGV
ncbi:AfsR/SARP family transcriptional regulator [Streptomyces xiaopingdaonensis]|uniref:AfsR/SARP family transcriptional regulator n=1 Tax=Streptomyces xiaopingdaonensis TaxID=1565415 RepID=UPI0002D94B3C|nr:tetratricopeptide repeat protein [Streptomyces xiaopingdaonensis]